MDDIRHEEPLGLRVFGLGNVLLVTTDVSTPTVLLYGIREAGSLVETIRIQSDLHRRRVVLL